MAFHFFTGSRRFELTVDELVDRLAYEGNEARLPDGCSGKQGLQHLDLPGLKPEFFAPRRRAAWSPHPWSRFEPVLYGKNRQKLDKYGSARPAYVRGGQRPQSW